MDTKDLITDAEIAGMMNWRGPGAYTQHAMNRVRRVVEEAVARAGAAPAGVLDDPMDTPLPCDVTVGSGTFGKGVKLRLFVMRMRSIYSDWEIMKREKYPDVSPTPFFKENTGVKDGQLISLDPSPAAAPAEKGAKGDELIKCRTDYQYLLDVISDKDGLHGWLRMRIRQIDAAMQGKENPA